MLHGDINFRITMVTQQTANLITTINETWEAIQKFLESQETTNKKYRTNLDTIEDNREQPNVHVEGTESELVTDKA